MKTNLPPHGDAGQDNERLTMMPQSTEMENTSDDAKQDDVEALLVKLLALLQIGGSSELLKLLRDADLQRRLGGMAGRQA